MLPFQWGPQRSVLSQGSRVVRKRPEREFLSVVWSVTLKLKRTSNIGTSAGEERGWLIIPISRLQSRKTKLVSGVGPRNLHFNRHPGAFGYMKFENHYCALRLFSKMLGSFSRLCRNSFPQRRDGLMALKKNSALETALENVKPESCYRLIPTEQILN